MNIKRLQEYQDKILKMGDGEKTKVVYIAHHEGPGGARKFFNNTLDFRKTMTPFGMKELNQNVYQHYNENVIINSKRNTETI